MAGCKNCCGCDHSSKTVRVPSLLDITVVEGIFRSAVSNMVDRERLVASGEMTDDDFEEAKAKLVRWLVAAFRGENPYYAADSEWHGNLMAEYLANEMDYHGHTDIQVITQACERFANHTSELAHDIVSRGLTVDDPTAAHVVMNFCGAWAALFTGAPSGED